MLVQQEDKRVRKSRPPFSALNLFCETNVRIYTVYAKGGRKSDDSDRAISSCKGFKSRLKANSSPPASKISVMRYDTKLQKSKCQSGRGEKLDLAYRTFCLYGPLKSIPAAAAVSIGFLTLNSPRVAAINSRLDLGSVGRSVGRPQGQHV